MYTFNIECYLYYLLVLEPYGDGIHTAEEKVLGVSPNIMYGELVIYGRRLLGTKRFKSYLVT